MASFTGVFSEVAIDSKLIIPPYKPPMECILDAKVDIEIIKAEVIDTPLLWPESTADPKTPLNKVIVVGIAHIKIKYSALVPDQKVHLAHFDVQFCDLFEWIEEEPFTPPPQGTPIEIRPVFERKVFKREDERRILKEILVRLEVWR